MSRFSAASGRGLIEAWTTELRALPLVWGFPRHRAAASLKPRAGGDQTAGQRMVFRGIGPRPH